VNGFNNGANANIGFKKWGMNLKYFSESFLYHLGYQIIFFRYSI
jgi:hypothetical protein